MAKYTNNEKECVFLNDKNIVCALTADSATGWNPIPSLNLLSDVHHDLSSEISSLRKDAGISAFTLSNVISSLSNCLSDYAKSSSLSDYAQLSDDNEFTGANAFKGGISIVGNDLSVISGNYIQCFGENVYNFSGSNSFLQQECPDRYKERYGIGCTGSRGYCILSVYDGNKVKLSGNVDELADLIASKSDTLFSMSLGNGSESFKYKVTSIIQETSSATITIDPSTTLKGQSTEDDYIEEWYSDDNAFYSPLNPDVGNAVVPSFYGNHAEGAATKALQRCTHTEGRDTIADIRYSHAEGSNTRAFGMGSHAEGDSNVAYASYSHAEGSKTSAFGDHSHTEGFSSQTSAAYAHAEGISAIAKGIGSHAECSSTYALGIASHAEGYKSIALGDASHAEGIEVSAFGKGSHAEGYRNGAIAEYSHAEGDGYCYAGTRAFKVIAYDSVNSILTLNSLTSECGSITNGLADKWIALFYRAKSDGYVEATFNTRFISVYDQAACKIKVTPNLASVAIDRIVGGHAFFPEYPLLGTEVLGSGAHAHGYQSHAMEDSTAFGCNNFAIGRYSFALGNANKTDYMGIAIGSGNGAFGSHSIAMGGNGSADASAIDSNTKVYATKAFGWSGNGSYEVPSTRVGTFNINPVNGISGFYIGNRSLYTEFEDLSGSLVDQLSGATIVTTLSNDLSTLSNELCSTSCYLSNELCFASCDLSTQLCATSSEVILSCNDAIRLTTQISSVLYELRREMTSDPTMKTLSEESELQLIAKAVVMMFKAFSSTTL